MRAVAVAGLGWALAACAVQPLLVVGPAPPHAVRWHGALDLAQAGSETVAVLAAYVGVDTTNPPGNESRGVAFLAAELRKDGIDAEELAFAPGRGSLLARLRGTGKAPPLCLVSHIDVVGANAALWPAGQGPLSGAIVDGELWGRGALDMKGMGALELQVLRWLKRLNVPLRRDVVLLAVADEEVDNQGMRHVVQQWERIGCSQSVNEGGIGIKGLLFPDQTVFAISVAEKGLLWLRMTAHGPSGHGSTPVPGRAPERLLAAIGRLHGRTIEPHIHGSLRSALAEAGAHQGGLNGFVLARPALQDLFVTGKLMGNPPTRAGITDTVHVTGLAGGSAPNVVPAAVHATLDCRLLPGTTPAAMLARLKAIVSDEAISFEVLHAASANESPIDDDLFRALARHAVLGRPDAVAAPVLSPGYTDSLLLRTQGVHAYGFVPFEVTPELAATMHGEGERVPVAEVHRGLQRLWRAVIDVAADDVP